MRQYLREYVDLLLSLLELEQKSRRFCFLILDIGNIMREKYFKEGEGDRERAREKERRRAESERERDDGLLRIIANPVVAFQSLFI